MIKIAICDDEKVLADFLSAIFNDKFNKLQACVEISVFYQSSTMLDHKDFNNFDIVFLDIDMPNLNGFELAKKIRECCNNNVKIIFISAMYDLVYESFEYQPFYFIKKSSDDILVNEIYHLCEKISNIHKFSKKIIVNTCEYGNLEISTNKILYVKSEKHYLLYYLVNSHTPLKERNTISQKENDLLPCLFAKNHQRFLVNLYHIKKIDIESNKILLNNNVNIPISRSFKKNILNKYKSFKRGDIIC